MALDDSPGPGPASTGTAADAFYFLPPHAHRKFQDRRWLHVLLFVITVGSTVLSGAHNYLLFLEMAGASAFPPLPDLVAQGFLYSATILGILGVHEMGHYFACRYYDIDASLPFFLPLPIISNIGTLGAVIKIREPFRDRTELFDVGIAGPIAGFVVLVPLLLWGLSLSNVVPIPTGVPLVSFGEPLLFKVSSRLVFGPIADGYTVNMHPVVLAAWFGMLATAWNLLPFGQLDGGHLMYALFRRASRYASIVVAALAVVMTFVTVSWALLALIMLTMLFFLGSRHPPVLDEHEPLAAGRLALAVFALVMLVVCIAPIPIELVGPR